MIRRGRGLQKRSAQRASSLVMVLKEENAGIGYVSLILQLEYN